MKTVNQTFNWSRFVAALRKDIVENKRGLMFTLLCIYGLLTMIMVFGNVITSLADATIDSLIDRVPQSIVAMIFTVVICVSASMAFYNLRTKTGRASMFTSPSSTLEKFLVNVLIYVVGIFVAYIVCAQLADITRFVLLWFFHSDNFMVPGLLNFTTCFADLSQLYTMGASPSAIIPSMGVMSTAFFVGLLANAGLYLLGSVIWPRLSLLKTFAAVYVIEFALFLIALPFFALFGDMDAFSRWFFELATGSKLSISILIWTIVEVILFFSLAWFLFKRKDVISLKWWK